MRETSVYYKRDYVAFILRLAVVFGHPLGYVGLSCHHQISFMELGHLLTRSDLTYPEVSSKVYHDSFCQLWSLSCEGSKVTLC